MGKKYFAFELGREFKLSISEINNIFQNGNIFFCDKEILILENIDEKEIIKNTSKLGGTIKIFILEEFNCSIEEIFEKNMGLDGFEGKFNYSINKFGIYENLKLKELLKISKKIIKEHKLNPRFINQDFKNISSVAIIKEALIKKGTDFNLVYKKDKLFFGKTIWVQDIYSYSNRDYSKNRDMNIGMLPPKLAQMMINIGSNGKENINIYDPFVGLGTVLIESIYMGNKNIYGSDLNPRMVEKSIENLEKIKEKFDFKFNILNQNAKYIKEIDFLKDIDLIVTEGYLGEIMTQNNINIERIEKQKEKLLDLYNGFFNGLKELKFKGKIVISFPFWEIKGQYFYFNEIYNLLGKYCHIVELLDPDLDIKSSKEGSLLYKRDKQLVGREIFVLKLKD